MPTLRAQNVDFDHVAHAAPRLRDLLSLYLDGLGASFAFGGDDIALGARIIRLELPSGLVTEVMEPLEGSHFFDSFFARSPRGGLHHHTYLVDDIVESARSMAESGFAPIEDADAIARARQFFVHPATASGTLMQFQERGLWDYSALRVSTLDEVLAGVNGTGRPSP